MGNSYICFECRTSCFSDHSGVMFPLCNGVMTYGKASSFKEIIPLKAFKDNTIVSII